MSTLAERPIFVIGAARSGTTLLRFMLSSHPRIYIPGQANFVPRLFQRHPTSTMRRSVALRNLGIIRGYKQFSRGWKGPWPNGPNFVDRLPSLTPQAFLDALYSEYAGQNGAQRWGDKSQTYISYVDLLAAIFPTAQFVHIIRDGRDVALSLFRYYRKDRFYVDLYFSARTWKQRLLEARAAAKKLPPSQYYELRYERLTLDPEGELKKLCSFLGEDYATAMMQPHLLAQQAVQSQSTHAPVRQPVTTARAHCWRQEISAADQRVVQTVAGDLLQELGYEILPLGTMSPMERWRHRRWQAKYTLLEGARRAAQAVGVYLPSLSFPFRIGKAVQRAQKKLQLLLLVQWMSDSWGPFEWISIG